MKQPELGVAAFVCPHCQAFSHQMWFNDLRGNTASKLPGGAAIQAAIPPGFHASQCLSCRKVALWKNTKMLWPAELASPPPNEDMPASALDDYAEARAVLTDSPRASAALLRLVLQKICKAAGQKGNNINDDIQSLVVDGLDVTIQQAMDVVRVIGNESVHPGQMDLKDDRATALQLFSLVNLVVEELFTKRRKIAEIFSSLPQDKRDAIAKRDAKANVKAGT